MLSSRTKKLLILLIVLATLAIVRFSQTYMSPENVDARVRAAASADAERQMEQNRRTGTSPTLPPSPVDSIVEAERVRRANP